MEEKTTSHPFLSYRL